MLVDDPPANAKEPDLFKGKTRTYYGRWTYKYEIGTAKNATGVILIHTTASAGYGWNVCQSRPSVDIADTVFRLLVATDKFVGQCRNKQR